MTKSTNESKKQIDLGKITTYQSGVVQASAFRLLKKHTNKCLLPHNLSTMQWFIIGTIYDSGDKGIRLTDLAKKVDTTLSYLTNAINELESRGILVRDESVNDSRAKFVSVASSYRSTCEKIEIDLRKQLRNSLYAKITPEDLRVYIKVLYQFATLED